MNGYQDWAGMAEAAETRGDWRDAKRCWYYAAQQLTGNPYELRTYYGQREDAAAARIPELEHSNK